MDFFQSTFDNSLARRLLVTAALMSLVLLAGLVLILSAVYRGQTLALLDAELDRTLTSLLRSVDADDSGNLFVNDETLPADELFNTALSGRYWVIAGADQETGTYTQELIQPKSLWEGEIPWPEKNIRRVIDGQGDIIRSTGVGPIGERVRMAAQSITLSGRSNPIILLTAFDRTETDRGAERFTWILVTAMSALAAIILLALRYGIRSALRPLSRVRHDIEEIREGSRTKLEGDYPSEVLPLSEELNKLLDHNRGVVERAQTHVGNLAHALKTPLAVMMNEAAGDTPLDDVVRRQAGAMHDNVQHYLKRARAAARAQTLGSRSAVAPVLADMGRLLTKLFAAKGITVTVANPENLYFRGEKQDLEEMVGNLMENACKWAKSRVQVSVQITEGGFLLHVDDDGNGLTLDERGAALQRGVRLDEAAPGTGLGLSIVTELAEMHEGRFVLDDAPELGGLRATLRLPSA
jgi:signal transduction histidine kinase